MVSNCNAQNNRLEYAEELANYIGVDIYGGCGTNRCGKKDQDCRAMLGRKYKFYLSFENSNCADYITEKFWNNALNHDMLPIVMGAPISDYKAVAPPNSFIHVDSFCQYMYLSLTTIIFVLSMFVFGFANVYLCIFES